MTNAQINLTESQAEALHKLSERTGKSEDELLQEAVNKLISEVSETEAKRQNRLESMRRAKGMWKNRDDLPDFDKLRTEWNRFDFGSD